MNSTSRLRPEPSVVTVEPHGLAPRARVVGGLDVWEYVMVARDYEWNVVRTAEHLRESMDRVQAALDHYRADPLDVHDRLRKMDEMSADPERFIPGVRVVRS